MTVEYDRKFIKDFQVVPEYIQEAFSELNTAIEEALTIRELPQCKRLTNKGDIYRIRLGDYRVTFSLKDNSTVEFRRILSRGQIYKKHIK